MVERLTVVVDAVLGILRNQLVTSSILVVRTSFMHTTIMTPLCTPHTPPARRLICCACLRHTHAQPTIHSIHTRSSLFALRSSLFALRSSLFALRSSTHKVSRFRSPR